MIVLRTITNPIEWQETRYQHARSKSFVPLGTLSGFLVLAGVVGLVVFTLRDVTSPTREVGMLAIWIVHALTGARAIAAGANAISREHDGQTWIPLILTGVSIRQILFGKWLGVLHRTAPWMLALGALRLAMLPVFMFALINRFAWRASYRGTMTGLSYYYHIEWVEWAAVIAVVMTLVLTILEVLACTALGLAASAVIKRGWLALIVAVCIRFAPVIAFAAFTRYEVGLGPSWRVLRFTPLAIADSGSAPLYQLSLPLTGWTVGTHEEALGGVLLATLLLVVLLAASLLVAWNALRAAGALPRPKTAPAFNP